MQSIFSNMFVNLTTDSVYTKILVSTALGFVIGLEREIARKDASLRTFSLISLAACIFSIISVDAANVAFKTTSGVRMADPGRVAAQVVSGIGFLGAGVIFRSSKRISGLTTAALMWTTAAIGMSVGYDRYDIAIPTTFITLIVMFLFRLFHNILHKIRKNQEEDEGDFT